MITVYPVPVPKKPETQNAADDNHVCDYRLVKLICSNGTIQFKNQCGICGATSSPIPKASIKVPVAQIPLCNPDLHHQYYNERWANRKQTIEQVQEKYNQSWWAWFTDYLNSDTWRGKRRLVLERAKGKCEACLTAGAVEVHHLTYERVGSEPLYDLVAVCKDCHTKIKEMKYHV